MNSNELGKSVDWKSRQAGRVRGEHDLRTVKAKIIARAWADSAFKARFVAQPKQVFESMGFKVDDDLEIEVVENTSGNRYLILVPKPNEEEISVAEKQNALISYPYYQYEYLALISRCWSEPSFKRQLIEKPFETLRSMGIDTPDKVSVVESSIKCCFFVLPECPSEGLAIDELSTLAAAKPECGGLSFCISRPEIAT